MKMKQRTILNHLSVDFCEDGREHRDYLTQKIKEIQSTAKHLLESSGKIGYSVMLTGRLESFLTASILADAFIPVCLIVAENDTLARKEAELLDRRYDDIIVQTVNPLPILHLVSQTVETGIYIDSCADYSEHEINSRVCMTLQYAMSKDMLTAGSLTQEKVLTGGYTKNGREFCDFSPLYSLIPEDLLLLAEQYEVPAASMYSMEDDIGGSSLCGITHSDINSFLKGNFLEKPIMQKIIRMYQDSAHQLRSPAENILLRQEAGTHLIIDMTGAFIDGSLACKNAANAVNKAVDFINEHPFMRVLYVRDSHPENHCSFIENGGIWPRHAVAGTPETEFAPQFYHGIRKKTNTPLLNYNVFNKGEEPDSEEYSGFSARNEQYGALKYNLTKQITVSGIATEYCIRETVQALLHNGFEVFLLKDALGYVNEDDHAEALAEMEALGAKLI